MKQHCLCCGRPTLQLQLLCSDECAHAFRRSRAGLSVALALVLSLCFGVAVWAWLLYRIGFWL